MLCKNVFSSFFNHVKGWFDDQDFIVVLDFYTQKKLRNLGNLAKIFLHALPISKKCNMTVFLSLEGSEEEWR